MTYLKKKLSPAQRAQRIRWAKERKQRREEFYALKKRDLLTLTKDELHRIMYHNPRSSTLYWKTSTGKLESMSITASAPHGIIQTNGRKYSTEDVLRIYHGENYTKEEVVAVAEKEARENVMAEWEARQREEFYLAVTGQSKKG